MSIQKHEIPILEYDADPRAVIQPGKEGDNAFPERAAFLFLGQEVEDYARSSACPQIGEFETITKTFPIFRTCRDGKEVCLCQAPLGAAAAAQFLDFLIGNGVRKIVAAGSCGALKAIPENEFLIPVRALRDEGASYHYLPPARMAELNGEAVQAIARTLKARGLAYETCTTWTTDGFFRETAQMVAYRREEGCTVVEMECAALAACAQFRGAVFGQLLYTADTLADAETYDARDWGNGAIKPSLELALAAVCAL
ncbi:MAG: nucleoside phosphorylase [Eubacteriales bacterium]|nr:nucleoside phosphorylase [Eubacteriales bacterium]